MINKARLVDCAEYDCGRTFATRSYKPVQYCPDCRRKRVRASQRAHDARRRAHGPDERLLYAEALLERRLRNAEFTVLEDAGPEEAAFSRGARLTADDVYYLLRYDFIAAGSLFLHNKSNICYRVERGEWGRLVLARERQIARPESSVTANEVKQSLTFLAAECGNPPYDFKDFADRRELVNAPTDGGKRQIRKISQESAGISQESPKNPPT